MVNNTTDPLETQSGHEDHIPLLARLDTAKRLVCVDLIEIADFIQTISEITSFYEGEQRLDEKELCGLAAGARQCASRLGEKAEMLDVLIKDAKNHIGKVHGMKTE